MLGDGALGGFVETPARIEDEELAACLFAGAVALLVDGLVHASRGRLRCMMRRRAGAWSRALHLLEVEPTRCERVLAGAGAGGCAPREGIAMRVVGVAEIGASRSGLASVQKLGARKIAVKEAGP